MYISRILIFPFNDLLIIICCNYLYFTYVYMYSFIIIMYVLGYYITVFFSDLSCLHVHV